MVVQPEEHHYRKEMAQVERRRCGIDAGVDADLLRLEDFVEDTTVTMQE